MTTYKYKLSFTTGGLFYREARKVAEAYFDCQDWIITRERILKGNLLQARTANTSIRTTREVIQRLQALTSKQLEIIEDGTRQDQSQILWLAVCKHYTFVREFAIEVIREKFYHFDFKLSYLDFDVFFNTKSEWNDDLEKVTRTTRNKLRQVLFRMLRETGILTQDNQILPVMISPRVAKAIAEDDLSLSGVFPITDKDFQKQVAR